MTVTAVEDKLCSHCIHAAFDESGVYCKEFHESIFNERVALDCGAFERQPGSSPVDRQLWGGDPLAEAAPVLEAVGSSEQLAALARENEFFIEGRTIEEWTAMFDKYLAKQHYQLWGQSFSITKDDDRLRAASWLAGVVTEVLREESEDGAT